MNTKQFETLSENELLKRIGAGEVHLFEILIRRNNPFLYKVGMSYGYTHHDVEDLMQETFISAFLNLDKFEQRATFKTWIIKIMINQCFRRAHKASFKHETTSDLYSFEGYAPVFADRVMADTYKVVVNKELRHEIGNAIIQLPLDYRMVFSLRELNGMSTSETAEVLAITESNVKVRLSRAKDMLRKTIKKSYSAEDIFEFNLIYCDKIVNYVMDKIHKATASHTS
jgi:RNA polymerase sigma factor (sigma-70 family)